MHRMYLEMIVLCAGWQSAMKKEKDREIWGRRFRNSKQSQNFGANASTTRTLNLPPINEKTPREGEGLS